MKGERALDPHFQPPAGAPMRKRKTFRTDRFAGAISRVMCACLFLLAMALLTDGLAGQTIRVEDAIKGLVTRSANDAAVVLAERIADSETAFAERMTAKATCEFLYEPGSQRPSSRISLRP